MLRKDKEGNPVWVQEFRYYAVKIDILEDNPSCRNFKFIEELIEGI